MVCLYGLKISSPIDNPPKDAEVVRKYILEKTINVKNNRS